MFRLKKGVLPNRVNLLFYLWSILLAMPYLNIFLKVGTGEWNRTGSNLDIRIKSVVVLLIMSVAVLSILKKRDLSLNRLILRFLIPSLFMLACYISSDFVNNNVFMSGEHIRLSSYVFCFIFTSLAISGRVRLNQVLEGLRMFFWLTMVFVVLCVIFDKQNESQRLGSGFVDSNYLGATLTLGLIYPASIFSRSSFFQKFLLILAGMSIFYAIILTGSNGALLNIGIVVLFLNIRASFASLIKIFGIVLFLVAGLFVASATSELRILALLSGESSAVNESVGSRLSQYINFFETFGQNLLTGIGSQRIPEVIGREMHNSILRPALSGGLIALLSWLIILRNFSQILLERRVGRLLGAFYGGWLVQSLTLPQETLTIFWFLFTIMLAVIIHKRSLRKFE